MGSDNSSEAKPQNEYVNGAPTVRGVVTKGFDQENGLLFRIVNPHKKQWAYYNDTKNYDMHVKVVFHEDCDIKAMGNTTIVDTDNGERICTVVVHPGDTEMFIKGRVNGFKAEMAAVRV